MDPIATVSGDGNAQDRDKPDYWRTLVQYADNERGEPPLGHFGKLQLMNIVHLLNEIAQIKGAVRYNQTTSADQMDLLQQRLHQYADAVRDYQYLTGLDEIPTINARHKRSALEISFPSIATSHPGTANYPYETSYRTVHQGAVQPRGPLRDFLFKALPLRLSWTEAEMRERPSEYFTGAAPERYSDFLDTLARFIVAFIGTLGGCGLIVPVVIMVFDPSLTKSLITVSIAVFMFALVLGFVFDTNNKDTIMATATYAAVLVVFIGTSGSVGGQDSSG